MHHKVSFHNCPNRQSDNYCRGKNNGASQNLWKISQHTSFFWFPAKLGIILVKDKPVSLIANKVSIREVGFFPTLAGYYPALAGHFPILAGNFPTLAGNVHTLTGNFPALAGNFFSWGGNFFS
jgi:hypothetical protein